MPRTRTRTRYYKNAEIIAAVQELYEQAKAEDIFVHILTDKAISTYLRTRDAGQRPKRPPKPKDETREEEAARRNEEEEIEIQIAEWDRNERIARANVRQCFKSVTKSKYYGDFTRIPLTEYFLKSLKGIKHYAEELEHFLDHMSTEKPEKKRWITRDGEEKVSYEMSEVEIALPHSGAPSVAILIIDTGYIRDMCWRPPIVEIWLLKSRGLPADGHNEEMQEALKKADIEPPKMPKFKELVKRTPPISKSQIPPPPPNKAMHELRKRMEAARRLRWEENKRKNQPK
jgi:hypothetical protein